MPLDYIRGAIQLVFQFLSAPVNMGYGITLYPSNVIIASFIIYLMVRVLIALTDEDHKDKRGD